jgi:hypothetical protein
MFLDKRQYCNDVYCGMCGAGARINSYINGTEGKTSQSTSSVFHVYNMVKFHLACLNIPCLFFMYVQLKIDIDLDVTIDKDVNVNIVLSIFCGTKGLHLQSRP